MLSQIPSLASIPGLQAALNAKAALAAANFTGPIAVNNGVLTVSAPGLTLAQTWNNAAVDFSALEINVTNTAGAATSKLLSLKLNGASVFAFGVGRAFFNYNGIAISGSPTAGPSEQVRALLGTGPGGAGVLSVTSGGLVGWVASGTDATQFFDTAIGRSAAGVIEFNNGTAGVFRDWKARRGTFTEYLEGPVSFEPAAPASGMRLWVNYTGGRSLLMARFATGASQVVANEP